MIEVNSKSENETIKYKNNNFTLYLECNWGDSTRYETSCWQLDLNSALALSTNKVMALDYARCLALSCRAFESRCRRIKH